MPRLRAAAGPALSWRTATTGSGHVAASEVLVGAVGRPVGHDDDLERLGEPGLAGEARQRPAQLVEAVVRRDDDADRPAHAVRAPGSTRAGTPAASVRGGTSDVTTLPAPTQLSWPTVTPDITIDAGPDPHVLLDDDRLRRRALEPALGLDAVEVVVEHHRVRPDVAVGADAHELGGDERAAEVDERALADLEQPALVG